MSAEKRKAILDEARQAVLKDRNTSYGSPEDSFGTIAELWTVYARRKGMLLPGRAVEPTDVALMLDLLKTARLVANPTHRDSWVDKAGYAACGGGLQP